MKVHLEQINVSSAAIKSLPFAPPKIFTNALLHSTDIVSLIRDTDAHERVLFTVPSAAHVPSSDTPLPHPKPNKARMSVAPTRNTAVHSVLGGDMVRQLRQAGAGGVGGGIGGVAMGEVDVELLLLGAEKLIGVYNIPGAAQRIESAREQFEHLTESITNYEALVEAQRSQLDLLHRRPEDEPEVIEELQPEILHTEITDEMLEEEEMKIRELESRKSELEVKIKSIDRKMNSVYKNL